MKFIETEKDVKLQVNGQIIDDIGDSKARTVWILPNHVVKIDTVLGGMRRTERQTAHEIDFWQTLQEDKHYFAGILNCGRTPMGRWWLIQKRYTPDENYTSESLQIVRDLIWKYHIFDVAFMGDDDNWFQVDGQPIIYDWGMG